MTDFIHRRNALSRVYEAQARLRQLKSDRDTFVATASIEMQMDDIIAWSEKTTQYDVLINKAEADLALWKGQL